MSRIEQLQTCLVVDTDERGRTSVVAVPSRILRLVELAIDCGCYNPKHATPRIFQIALPERGAYIRAIGDCAFRTIDVSGPITVTIEKEYKP